MKAPVLAPAEHFATLLWLIPQLPSAQDLASHPQRALGIIYHLRLFCKLFIQAPSFIPGAGQATDDSARGNIDALARLAETRLKRSWQFFKAEQRDRGFANLPTSAGKKALTEAVFICNFVQGNTHPSRTLLNFMHEHSARKCHLYIPGR